MLDIRLIREKADFVKERLKTRNGDDHHLIDQLLTLDEKRRSIITQVEQLKSERNRVSKEIGLRKREKQNADDLMAGMKEVSDQISALDHRLAELEKEQRHTLLLLPNIPHAECPLGTDETHNPEIHTFGTKPEFSFSPKDHITLGTELDILDFEAGAKISGSGFFVMRGAGAKLERALISFLLDHHTTKNGYTEVAVPFIIRDHCMEGTSQLPKFKEDAYHLPEDNLFLTPTAEVPVTNLHREEILKTEQLPINYVAYTPCFRREAGSAGKDTRGIQRVHQFDKVEMVKITTPENSYSEHEKLRRHAEELLEIFGLHYRTIELCSGDIGFGAARCYDLEVWAPGMNTYLEVSSCSNFEAFQARRMNLRYKDKDGKNHFCHTINGSGLALPRLVIALLETYQQANGSIKIPEPLTPYFHTDTIPVSS